MKIINWSIYPCKGRKFVTKLHPAMFTEIGHLVAKDNYQIQYDRNYVLAKLRDELQAMSYCKNEFLQVLKEIGFCLETNEIEGNNNEGIE